METDSVIISSLMDDYVTAVVRYDAVIFVNVFVVQFSKHCSVCGRTVRTILGR